MIHVHCKKCGDKLTKTGALVFSPPYRFNITFKYHLCRACWKALYKWLNTREGYRIM